MGERSNTKTLSSTPPQQSALSGYRIMWIFVLFDLPVGTKKERKAATKFRETLLDLGFEMSQFSVYLKFTASKEQAEAVERRVEQAMPSSGKSTWSRSRTSNMKISAPTGDENGNTLPKIRISWRCSRKASRASSTPKRKKAPKLQGLKRASTIAVW
jgi:CRISPR-associated endonuclease Cas2